MLIDENTKFTLNTNADGYAELMSLIFEDENNSSADLKPIVYNGMLKGLAKYHSNSRDADFFTYVTFFVKREVTKYKQSK